MTNKEFQTQMARMTTVLNQALRERDQAKGLLLKEIESNQKKTDFIAKKSQEEQKFKSNLYVLLYKLKDNYFSDSEKVVEALKILKEIGIN